MALQMGYTDACGNTYQNAYFRAVQINIGALAENINLTFMAYKDEASFNSGLQPLTGGQKQYNINGEEFSELASAAPVGANLYDVLANAAETYALNKMDTGGKSFFDGASQISG